MSFRGGGGRARRIRARGGGARKADRAPKSAADLDAEMEVCTFDVFFYLPNLRPWPSGLYSQQWTCCRCLSNFDFSLTCLLYIVFLCCLFFPQSSCYYPYPPLGSSVSNEQCLLFLSCHALLCNVVIANISYTRMLPEVQSLSFLIN